MEAPELGHPQLPVQIRRPGGVTVFGVLNIVFAVLGAGGMFLSLAMMGTPELIEGDPTVAAINASPVYAAYMKVSTVLTFVGSGVLIVAGIGLLLVKRWARKLAIGYSIYALVAGAVGVGMNVVYLLVPMLGHLGSLEGSDAIPGLVGAIVGVVVGAVALFYPAIQIWYLRKRNVMEAFGG